MRLTWARAIGAVRSTWRAASSAAARNSSWGTTREMSADPLGLCGVEHPRREQQIPGDRQADVRGQGGGVRRVGDTAQELGHPEGRPVAGHGDVGHHGDEEPARLADAVDRRDHRCPALADGREGEDVVSEIVGRRVPRFRTAAEIAARREHVPGARDDQRRQRRIGVHEPDGPLDPVVHRRRERVPGRRPVDHAPGDRPLPLEAESGCAQLVVHRALLPPVARRAGVGFHADRLARGPYDFTVARAGPDRRTRPPPWPCPPGAGRSAPPRRRNPRRRWTR